MSPLMIAILLVFLACLYWFASTKSQRMKLPPGPQPLPIIGNLHMLGTLPHRSLLALSNRYGHIMSFRLGSVPVVVISSPKAAELFLKTHDLNFASRPKVQSSEFLSYGSKGLAFSEYGSYWRHVRKVCTLQLLCPSKVEAFTPVRKEEIGELVGRLRRIGEEGGVVNASDTIKEMTEDITYRMVLGTKKVDDRFDLKGIVQEMSLLIGAFNISDCLPFLSALDLQGFGKRLKNVSKIVNQLLDMIIEVHEKAAEEKGGKQGQNDLVDTLLAISKEALNPNDEQVHFLDRDSVKAILLDMINAAFDSSSNAIIWSLTEIIRNPRIMRKVQQELENVVGLDRMVEEYDLPKLDYLNDVIKESFRLHPVAPLLVPHESINDITIEGYNIPKKTRIIVNYFSFGRDPNVWSENFEEFLPERFTNNNIDIRGQDYQLIPFGAGRRGCPGMQLGLTTVRIILAQLVHCFNWELPNGMLPQEMDMGETFGVSMSDPTLVSEADLQTCVACMHAWTPW